MVQRFGHIVGFCLVAMQWFLVNNSNRIGFAYPAGFFQEDSDTEILHSQER